MFYPCFWASSLALALSIFAIRAADFDPSIPPPQCLLISSPRSLKLVLITSRSLLKFDLKLTAFFQYHKFYKYYKQVCNKYFRFEKMKDIMIIFVEIGLIECYIFTNGNTSSKSDLRCQDNLGNATIVLSWRIMHV